MRFSDLVALWRLRAIAKMAYGRKSSYFLSLIVIVTASCSSHRNTWTSKAYHNTTAHFNGYYYAAEEIKKIEKAIHDNHTNDYSKVLRLYPTFDSTLAKSYDQEVQEAVKMASLAIQRHSNSKWVDDAYILVGKARLYSLDWANAVQTFKHVNSKSKDKDARHLAIINLIRTYIEHHEYGNGQAAIDYLQKQKLNKANQKNFLLEKAYYYQRINDHDNMVRNLTRAEPLLKKRDKRGRIYFIIGQVYQKLGFEPEAYNYYKKCIGTNPEYEIDFYARLYMAQVREINRSRDIQSARKSFRKLLKDSKNKEFQDKIYYEMGIFELKHKNLPEAVKNLNLSVRKGNNKKIDGEAYLKLGEIYYDTLRNYELSQAYYDSAVSALPNDYENYEKIKARQEILNEFVKHLKTIQWQDSLLVLSTMDSLTIKASIDSLLSARKKAEEGNIGKKKKRARVEISANDNPAFNTGTEREEATEWYFGNPAAMSIGRTAFTRKWGNVKLEDNWRRSQRQSTADRPLADNSNTNTSGDNATGEAKASETTVDPAATEYAQLASQIPRTEEARKQALAKIEEAYFHLGDIYYFKLQESENAAKTYLTLLERFPETVHEPEALYTLYLIYKDTDSTRAETYASRLKQKHPNSTFAKILVNPDYLQESSLAVAQQKTLYRSAYDNFVADNDSLTHHIIDEALALGETDFSPRLILLRILLTGKTEDISKYQYELNRFIETYDGHELTAYAEKLLDASRDVKQKEEKRKGIQYIPSFDEPHYFVIVYKRAENIAEKVSVVIDEFNQSTHSALDLKTSNLIFDENYAMSFVAQFPENSTAVAYYRSFIEKLPSIRELRNHKFDNFVITKNNFEIFYRTKGLNEYLRFFGKNYPAEKNQ